MPLDGKIALVTGAGSGIGRALAIELSRRGAFVFLAGRRREPLEETRERLAAPDRSEVVRADVTRSGDRARIVEAVRARGRLDLLFNNAGTIAAASLADTDDARLEQLLATNVAAPFALSRDLLPLFRAAQKPRIVNIGSMFGDIPFPFFSAYSATKFALRGLSNALRAELAPAGIGVTYAAPRAARTGALPEFAHLVGPLRLRLDEPGAVARRIVDAAERGRRSVYPAGPERLFVLLSRLIPDLVERSVARQCAALPGGRGPVDGKAEAEGPVGRVPG
jgi:NAD(P)-dependent dehydrogenase (short-subunit alcohol dehydrogenase family)